MKRVMTVNICVLMIMFLTAGMTAGPSSDSRQIRDLITQRSEILNGYYCGQTEFDRTRDSLGKIETGRLLRQDTKAMGFYAATDIEQVTDCRVRVLKCRKSEYGIYKGNAEITYVLNGTGGRFTQKGRYYFTGEKYRGKMKLTQLKKI
ncbi:MAG: hypothetical protein U0M33_02335 [Lachnospiraceae bacterium]|nr:hypothetical protein [Lachnospiraceae bacterium]